MNVQEIEMSLEDLVAKGLVIKIWNPNTSQWLYQLTYMGVEVALELERLENKKVS